MGNIWNLSIINFLNSSFLIGVNILKLLVAVWFLFRKNTFIFVYDKMYILCCWLLRNGRNIPGYWKIKKKITNFNQWLKKKNSNWKARFSTDNQIRDCCKKSRLMFFHLVFLILMIMHFCVYVLKVDTLTIPKW